MSVELPADLRRVVLIGFSATGKSVVASALARELGWQAVDCDTLIEAAAGMPIPDIFATDGEAGFREREGAATAAAAERDHVVIATGGGAWLDPANRRALAAGGFVVCLEARPATILGRHTEVESARADARPMLAGEGEPLARIERLKAKRQPFYALCDATVHTDELGLQAVVDEILIRLERGAARTLASDSRLHEIVEGPGLPQPAADYGAGVAAVVEAGEARYPVYCEWGALARLPEILDRTGIAGRVFIVADEAVVGSYAEHAVAALRSVDRDVALYSVPSGEASKNLRQLQDLYGWLSSERAERRDAVLAIGGGVTTDLAGTVAATYLRGMSLVHAPTTLLGMVDASIGGKVAIDLPGGKNLVGAFYQPRAVVADVSTLATLPERELRAGFAEVIKHGLIRDPAMLDLLDDQAALLLNPAAAAKDAVARDAIKSVIRRNMAIKAAVVSADEREADLRAILNYGHTIGHALEAVSGYRTMLHGEAVAVGMIAAARIGRDVGLTDEALVGRHATLLQRFGLPTSASEQDFDGDALREAMGRDKKVQAGKQRWVLLESVGSPVLRDDVPAEVVASALASVT